MKKTGCLFKVLLGLAVCVCVTAVWAQNAGAPGVPVHLVVTAEARHGSDVPEITQRDVMVHEGHDRDAVTGWIPARGDNAALELFILLDDGSDTNLGTQLEGLRKFIMGQPASTKVGVAYMQDGRAKVEQSPTSDHALAAKALRLPMGLGGVNASPYFALSDLVKRWPESAARREVFMATDGIDRYYDSNDLQDPYLDAAIDDAGRAGIVVFSVYTPGAGHFGHSYWQNYWGQMYLSRVAEETGGESYYIGFTGAPVTFGPYLEDMDRHLNNQYLLTFNAKAQKKSGLQRIKVTTEVSNAELVSAHKVYVPAATP
ncbi:MAG: vWA domain-containing protein [Candidatus Sulfotelmatobacter sp.]